MFLAGFLITIGSFLLIMELRMVAGSSGDDSDEDVTMDLDMKIKDDRDLISAAKKQVRVDEQKSERLNKVEELTEEQPEVMEVIQFKPDLDPNVEELKNEDPPINLNDDDPETLRIVEELPEFPGGMVEFVKWLTKNLNYPSVALRQKKTGTVKVSFIVETDGSISNLKLTQRVNTYLDNEALRVMRLMPKWKPGKDHGVVCRTMIAIPIVFEI